MRLQYAVLAGLLAMTMASFAQASGQVFIVELPYDAIEPFTAGDTTEASNNSGGGSGSLGLLGVIGLLMILLYSRPLVRLRQEPDHRRD